MESTRGRNFNLQEKAKESTICSNGVGSLEILGWKKERSLGQSPQRNFPLPNRAARIVTDSDFDTSAAPLIQGLGWPTSGQLIHRETSTMTYKCLNQLAPAYLSDFFSKLSDSHSRFLWNSETDVHIPRMRTSNGQKSFAYCGAIVWNDLHSNTKLASSIQCFKSRLKNYLGL